jgi:RHS repeat-associated protein
MNPGTWLMGGGGGGGSGSGSGKGGKGGKEGASGKDKGKDATGGGDGSGGCGDPVCPITGKVFLEYLDFAFPAPNPLSWRRHYSSRASDRASDHGFGWSHSYGWWIEEQRRHVCVFDEKAREQMFPRPTDNGPSESGGFGWLLRKNRTGYELALPDGRMLEFERFSAPRVYRLVGVVDNNGNRIRFERDEAGKLTGLVDSAGRPYRVRVDAVGRLAEIAVATEATHSQWMMVARYTYDEAGDLVAFQDAEGFVWRYFYKNHLLVEHQTPNGLSYFWVYDGETPKAYCIETWGEYRGRTDAALEHPIPPAPTNGPDLRKVKGINYVRFEYQKEAHYTEAENGLGGLTRYFGDSFGRIVKQVNPDGGVTVRSYDEAHGGLAEEIRPDESTLKGLFDEEGRPIGYVGPDGSMARTDTFGAFDEIYTNDGTGSSYHRRYDRRGNVVYVAHRDGTHEEYDVDERGLVTRIVDRTGETRHYEHDQAGNLVRMRFPDGGVETFEYDYLGRRIAHEDYQRRRTEWRYDRRNEIVGKRHPDGTEIHVTRDAERMPVTAYEGGRTYRFEYGGIKWLTRIVNSSGAVTEYRYDVEGNLTLLKNARGQEYRQTFDASSRKIRAVTFEGLMYEVDYKLGGGPRTVRAPDGLYSLERDALDRVTLVEAPDGSTISFDRSPGLFTIDNGVAPIRRIQDDEGRILFERQAKHETKVGWFASAPKVVQSDVGPAVEQTFGANMRVTAMTVGNQRFGVERAVTTADGYDYVTTLGQSLVLRQRYSAAGLLEYQCVAKASPAIPYTSAATADDPGTVLWRRYEYDDDHILRSESRSSGVHISYEKTAEGQIRERSVHAGNALVEREIVRFDPAGTPMLDGVRFDALMRPIGYRNESFEYDAAGRLARRMTDAGEWTYEWGPIDTLIRVKAPNDVVVEMEYDAFGRRTRKLVLRGGELTKCIGYVWSNNVVLHERDELQGKTRTYVRLREAWEPLAIVDTDVQGERVLLQVNDPIGAADSWIDDSGRVVAEGQHSIYGDFTQSIDEAQIAQRYPNQFWDPDVELVYNYKRWYDPRLGLYVSPDPILLEGTLNPRDYATNPLKFIDPLGLSGTAGTNPASPPHGHPPRPAAPTGSNNNYDANYLARPGYNATNGTPAVPGFAVAPASNPMTRSFGSPNDPTSMRSIVDAAGDAYGCHSCGRTREQVTKEDKAFNHWIPDHQPPVSCMKQHQKQKGALPPGECRLYPHCPRCSGRQKTVLSPMSTTTSKPELQQQMANIAATQMAANQANSNAMAAAAANPPAPGGST